MKVISCDTYHPYWHLGKKNSKANRLTGMMMDFKSASSVGHAVAVGSFAKMLLDYIDGSGLCDLLDESFQITIVPSHAKDRVSPALTAIANEICRVYPSGTVNQSLRRHTEVPSAHNGGGDRSVENHMNTISLIDGVSVNNEIVLLLDDVTTTGGSMTACYNILSAGGAYKILPIALLQTASYEGA